jgi:RNA polymerase sigma-70 factor (ECF subfamily)
MLNLKGKDTYMTEKQQIDEQEIEMLFRLHYRQLLLISIHHVQDPAIAEDIVQEFFINYWERISQGIQTPDNFRAYAIRAVKNRSIDFFRRQNVADKRSAAIPEIIEAVDAQIAKEELEERNTRLLRIFELIDQLPESRKQILKLHALNKYTYAQIAERQGVSINTVRSQLTKAYSSLRRSASGLALLALLKYF